MTDGIKYTLSKARCKYHPCKKLYSKEFPGCCFSQCNSHGAHTPQLTIQLNNEGEGRTSAKSFFSSGKCVWGRLGEGGLDRHCRDSLVGSIRSYLAALFITSATHGSDVWMAHSRPAWNSCHWHSDWEKKKKENLGLLNIKRFQKAKGLCPSIWMPHYLLSLTSLCFGSFYSFML